MWEQGEHSQSELTRLPWMDPGPESVSSSASGFLGLSPTESLQLWTLV